MEKKSNIVAPTTSKQPTRIKGGKTRIKKWFHGTNAMSKIASLILCRFQEAKRVQTQIVFFFLLSEHLRVFP